MRFLAFLDETTGVRGFVVSNAAGEHLADMGTGTKLDWTAARVAAIAQELATSGAIVGLGGLASAAVKGNQSSRLLAPGPEGVALLDLDPARATADLEVLLRSTEWLSEPLSAKPAVGADVSHLDTMPPRPAIASPPARAAQSSTGVSMQPSPANTAAPGKAQEVVAPLPEQQRRHADSSAADGSVPRPSSRAGVSVPRPPPLPPRASRRAAEAQAQMPLAAAVHKLASDMAITKTKPPKPIDVSGARNGDLSGPRGSAPLLTGSLGTFALPDLLEFLRVGKRSGTLLCSGKAGLGAIHLSGGQITGVASPGVPSIGDWLVERGAISRGQLHEALRHQLASGATVPLGTTLVAEKFVSREALREALSLHVASVVRNLMTWESGDFTFDPVVDSEASALALGVEVDPQGVLLDIFKDMDHSQRA
ncbi:MAG TPA: DUF4388 domain-containing protein [Polyangiaceae bacterium]|jgi:hypothetical protein|nr:DUF4388 domain-containing protein [Polyangiaceae bacterium]